MLTGTASAATFSMVTNHFIAERSSLAYRTWLYPTQGEWRASPSYKPSKPYRRLWTLKEEETVQLLYPSGMATQEIADQLGRSISSVRAKARQLGVRRPLRGKAVTDAVSPPPPRISRLICQ